MDRGTVYVCVVICGDLTWASFVALQTQLLYAICCQRGKGCATVPTNQYIAQHRHSVMHNLWHIPYPTCFGTGRPSSGCNCNRGRVQANMPIQGVSRLMGITVGADFLALCDQCKNLVFFWGGAPCLVM